MGCGSALAPSAHTYKVKQLAQPLNLGLVNRCWEWACLYASLSRFDIARVSCACASPANPLLRPFTLGGLRESPRGRAP